MWGTPHRSRTMRTGAERPAAVNVPETCAASGGGGGELRRQPCTNDTRHTTETTDTKESRRALDKPLCPWPPLCPCCSKLFPMAIKDALLTDVDHEMGTTRKLLERLPDD